MNCELSRDTPLESKGKNMEIESMIAPLKGPHTEQEEHGHAQTNCLEHKAINAES